MRALIRGLLWHVMPLNWIGAAIGAAASLIGGAASANNRGATGWDKQVYADQKARQDMELQRRVKDAKLAGLHPLFALGSSPSYAPTIQSGQSGGTGSAIGQGIAQAGSQAGKALDQYNAQNQIQREENRRQELHEANMRQNTHQDWLDEQEKASIMKRSEQNANSGPRYNPDGSVVIPQPYASSIERNPLPKDRPTRQEPNVNAPKWTIIKGADGQEIKLYHESAQADELNQFLIWSQELFNIAGGVNAVAKMWGVSPTEAGKQAYKIWKRLSKKSSGYDMRKKGERSLKELRSNPNF